MAEEEEASDRVFELQRELTQSEWFLPSDGLAAVEPLVSFLLGHPEALGDSETTWWAVGDLRAIELLLREAMARRDRFALEEY